MTAYDLNFRAETSANEFERAHAVEWEELERLITSMTEKGKVRSTRALFATAAPIDEFPMRYRRICQHLALARDRHYPPQIIERLNHLALASHQVFYAARTGLGKHILDFITTGFPVLVRQHARLFWIATAFVYIPALLMALLVWLQPEMVHSLLPSEQVTEFETMYRPGKTHIGFKRDSDINFMMFGHYIQNNISIGFRCFASGLLLGVGTIVMLIFNGLLLGAVGAHLTHIGYAENFFQFVVGHSAFELTAIVLCGMAGLMLGNAILSPGRLTRKEALASAARVAVKIVYGAAGMLVIAAFIEAFWSSSTYVPPLSKYVIGTLLWSLVGAYFVLMGHDRES